MHIEKNPHKTDTVRELGSIDPFPVIRLLPQLINEWDSESTYQLNGNKTMTLSEVQHINFRWSYKNRVPIEYLTLPLWEKYKDTLLPIMREVVKPLGYAKGYFTRVMLAKMLPGSSIPSHIDGKLNMWAAHKIHVPLITNDQAEFSVAGQTYYFEKGKSYEVNNAAKHWAKNNGDTARIHLIFEYLDAEINDLPCSDL
ncbi:aspartyl/asparaginyl beta-hydroxylase domain-containing protein [Pedobacter sp. MC2016-14]|uniref:aspartyl/asparaginyl beta-hydroxylase domain-containing protein n=1 Tax=Pedobacter sp. MC2016-14 TaxID=2897327 RepID=UPI001E539E51|nr:aspartyl/asparaginyl beta-hydroxylase domain-containing protein [Pedobacter sp. MC2016-14]MCD0486917.1 aspartyl/asparaginyl beta-hydroxylase domain-containing protein [Pedobacter sp. MC2016-14]